MALLTTLSELKFFGMDLINVDGVSELLMRFCLNMIVTGIIIGWLYYGKSKRRDYVFTFTLISVTVFLLVFLLGSQKLQIGLALGLFAIFGIIRYRTETVPIREMTYLFLIIGISVINSLAGNVSAAELLITNSLFILFTWVMESSRFVKHISCKIITYEKIGLIKPEREQELIADIKERTGLNVTKVEIGNINFLKDIAFIKVFYESGMDQVNTMDQVTITQKRQFE
jgi:hypothetical protein